MANPVNAAAVRRTRIPRVYDGSRSRTVPCTWVEWKVSYNRHRRRSITYDSDHGRFHKNAVFARKVRVRNEVYFTQQIAETAAYENRLIFNYYVPSERLLNVRFVERLPIILCISHRNPENDYLFITAITYFSIRRPIPTRHDSAISEYLPLRISTSQKKKQKTNE